MDSQESFTGRGNRGDPVDKWLRRVAWVIGIIAGLLTIYTSLKTEFGADLLQFKTVVDAVVTFTIMFYG